MAATDEVKFVVQRSPQFEYHKDHQLGHVGRYDVVELNTEGKCGRYVVSGITHRSATEIALVFNAYYQIAT